MKKLYLYIIVGVIIIATGGYFVLGSNTSKAVKYRTEKISRGSVVVQVRATGTINPVRTVDIGSQVSGTIAKLFVDYNSVVREGQVLAIIDSTFLYASVKEAQANLDRNVAQVNEAKRTLDRTKELFSKGLVAQADMDVAQTTYESNVAQANQTRAALDRAQVNLRYAVIRAPINGVIIDRVVDVGQTVAASLQTPKLFSIANDLSQMQVLASVDEADIGQIKENQLVTFSVDSYPDDQFRGRVSQIRLAPVTVQNVVTYTVVIDVPNPALKLRPGMTATVSVLIDKHEDILRISTLALRFQPPQEMVKEKAADQSVAAPQTAQNGGQSQQRDTSRHAGGRQGGQWMNRGGGNFQGRGNWAGRHDQGDDSARQGEEQKAPKIGRLWILDPSGNIKAVQVTLGLNDNRYVEVTGDLIKEGDEVVLSALGSESAQTANGQTNPFAPRGPMGGGGGGRGGGR